jgi:transposase InsO family protein
LKKNEYFSGIDKTYFNLKPLLSEFEIKIGRDKFREVMRDVCKRKKQNSGFKYIKPEVLENAKNNIRGIVINRVNQVWGSDFTYFKLNGQQLYLAITMDLRSRRILGYQLSNSLNAKDLVIPALLMASINGLPEIHHNDRGTQYTSKDFTTLLERNNIEMSFSDPGSPTQNAIVERTIGTLKNELNIVGSSKNISELTNRIECAINYYNNKRPHWGLKLKTPSDVYFNCQPIAA